jgi:hypothetical protein
MEEQNHAGRLIDRVSSALLGVSPKPPLRDSHTQIAVAGHPSCDQSGGNRFTELLGELAARHEYRR